MIICTSGLSFSNSVVIFQSWAFVDTNSFWYFKLIFPVHQMKLSWLLKVCVFSPFSVCVMKHLLQHWVCLYPAMASRKLQRLGLPPAVIERLNKHGVLTCQVIVSKSSVCETFCFTFFSLCAKKNMYICLVLYCNHFLSLHWHVHLLIQVWGWRIKLSSHLF